MNGTFSMRHSNRTLKASPELNRLMVLSGDSGTTGGYANPVPPQGEQKMDIPSEQSSWQILLRGLGTIWCWFGAVLMLACIVANMPVALGVDGSQNVQRGRRIEVFLVQSVVMSIVRMLYIAGSSDPRILLWLSKQISFLSKRFPSLSIFWLHWDMSPYCVWVQFVCSCTLFLLFCQGHQGSESTETYRKQKANGTFMSSMETYSEHAYTLPLLAACRLASSSFGMDHGASESAATATPNTHLHKFDWVLGAGSVLAYLTMISTIPRTDASCAPVEDSPWGFFLQFSLFTILASVYLVQDRLVVISRFWDSLIKGIILIVGCVSVWGCLRGSNGDAVKNPTHNYYTLKAWGSYGGFAVQAILQVWSALLSCRWFVALGNIVSQHLDTLDLELQEHHAADVDDISFALAAASLFAASYASLPPKLDGTTIAIHPGVPMKGHTFALLEMLGVALLILTLIPPVQWILHVCKRGVVAVSLAYKYVGDSLKKCMKPKAA